MPWECKGCNSSDISDDALTCPTCGENKAAWTMVADKTRTFTVTRKKKRVEYFRGVGGERRSQGDPWDEVEIEPTEVAMATSKGYAQRIADAGELPEPARILVARIYPSKATDYDVTVVLPFAADEPQTLTFEPHEDPAPAVEELTYYDVRFFPVFGSDPWPEDVTFEGLHVLDVSEDVEGMRHLETIEITALGRKKRKVLPLEPLGSAYRLRCRRLGFHEGSTKLLPASLPALASALTRAGEGGEHVVVVSHVPEEDQLPLAEARAKSLAHMLTGDLAWREGQSEGEHYSQRDLRAILTWAQSETGWGCHPGPPSDEPVPGESILAFEQGFQREFASSELEEPSDAVDDDFWIRVQALYARELAERLEVEGGLAGLDELAGKLTWLDPERQALATGAAYPPADLGEETDETGAERTEVLFFAADDLPEAPEGADVSSLLERIYAGSVEDLPCTCDGGMVRMACNKLRHGEGSAVLRPEGLVVLRDVLQQVQARPKSKLLIAVHASDAGLAGERADGLVRFLRGEHWEWAEGCKQKHTRADLRAILRWAARVHGWDCDPGPGAADEAPQRGAVLNFRKAWNAHVAGYADWIQEPVDEVDDPFWLQVFTLYAHQLTDMLGFSDLRALQTAAEAVRWADGIHAGIGVQEQNSPPGDGDALEEDGWVEFVFFAPDMAPLPDGDGDAYLQAIYGPEAAYPFGDQIPCGCQAGERAVRRYACNLSRFHPESAIPLPASLGYARGVLQHKGLRHGELRLLAAGYAADPELGKRRAQAMLALLTGDVETWQEACAGHSDDDVRSILAWAAWVRGWNCDPGDGELTGKVQAFKQGFAGAFHPSAAEHEAANDTVDEAFWTQVLTVYAARLADMLDLQRVADLDAWAAGIRWADPSCHAVGLQAEGVPLPTPEGADDWSEDPARVDLLFFAPGEAPDFDAPGAEPQALLHGEDAPWAFEDLTCSCGQLVSGSRLACAGLNMESVVPRPSAVGPLAAALTEVARNRTREVLIVGHGGELAEARALSLRQVLTGDGEGFAASCVAHSTEGDVDAILTWAAGRFDWDCDPKQDAEPVREFKAAFRARHGGAASPTNEADAAFWTAVLSLYAQELKRRLSLESLADLDRLASQIRWAETDPAGCADTTGAKAPAGCDGERVEILFLPPGRSQGWGPEPDAQVAQLYADDTPHALQLLPYDEDELELELGDVRVRLLVDGQPVEAQLDWFLDGKPAQAHMTGDVKLPRHTADGVVVVEGLPWGRYSIIASLPGGEVTRKVALPLTRGGEGGGRSIELPTSDDAASGLTFELGVVYDVDAPIPWDYGKLVLNGPKRIERSLGEGQEYQPFLLFPFEGVKPGERYSLTYESGPLSTRIFEETDLSALQAPSGPLLVVQGEGKSGLTAVRLDGQELPYEEGSGYSGYVTPLSSLPLGRLTVVADRDVTSTETLTLELEERSGERVLRFTGAPLATCSLTRLRVGNGTAWGGSLYVLTVAEPQERLALVIPGTDGEPTEAIDQLGMRNNARKLVKYYEQRGFTTRQIWGQSYDTVIAHLRDAAARGERYERIVFIGHGGWDGPMLHSGGQYSPYLNPEGYEKLVDALAGAVSPSCKLFTSCCHTAGSDRMELPRQEPDYDRMVRELGDRFPSEMPDDWQFEFKNKQSLMSRWSVELGRRLGIVAGGPAGKTSVDFTMNHVRICLEGEVGERGGDLSMHQESYVAFPASGVVYKLMPGQLSLTAGEVQALEAPDVEPTAPSDVPWGPFRLTLPIGAR